MRRRRRRNDGANVGRVAEQLWGTFVSPGPLAQEGYTVSDFISELANKSGINLDMAKKALGAILAFFKEKLPADTFAKVTAAVPEAEGLMADAAAAPEAQAEGGVMHAITEWAGKRFGGGGASAALSKLTSLGLSADQIKKFLPNVLAFLKGKLPAEAMNQISGLLPVGEEAAAGTHA
jgi:hypothetical protein